MKTVRLLTVADLHQRSLLYEQLADAVATHRPNIVACVGDFLDAGDPKARGRITAEAAAATLAGLDAEHVVFVRGNHEEEEWIPFINAWPRGTRPLIALHGTEFVCGPLVLIGFPCYTGWDGIWESTMAAQGNIVPPVGSGKGKSLPEKLTLWLKPLRVRYGPAARAVWLMHEPPVAEPIAHPIAANRWFREAVERYQPLLTASGHDHTTPLKRNCWHAAIGPTTCINAGQGQLQLHYCVCDFTFPGDAPSLPCGIQVTAYPWRQSVTIPR